MESPGIKSLLVVLGLITTVCCQQPIVAPNPIAANQPFTVYCDASRVTIPNAVTNINKLQISRNLSTSSAVVAYYFAAAPQGFPPSGFNIPQGRDWNFTFTGNNVTSGGVSANRNTMKIEWAVRDTKCEDAGIYQCHVDYYQPGSADTAPIDNKINVTATAGISDITLDVAPDDGSRMYKTNDNVTFTCGVQGPYNQRINWRIGTWPPGSVGLQENDADINAITIKPTVPPTTNSGCPFYVYESSLNVLLIGNNEEQVYICIVADSSNTPVMRKNITINIGNQAATQANTGNNPDKGGSVGMIVGIVIGCVVLIALVIIVIVVVRRRQRKREGDYKDNTDQADGNRNTDLHAPPPVFYPSSKPSKGSKDDDKDIKTQNMRHDIPNDDDDGNKRGNGKSRDRAPYYEGNYSYEQEPASEQNNRKGHQGAPRYNKQSSRGEPHYASTDVSHSGDESAEHSDAPLDGNKSRPRATRRSQVPPRGGKQLHYADLDLPQRMDGSESGSEAGRRRVDAPVEYAEIRV